MKEDIPSASSIQNYDYENDQHVFAIDSLVHELGLPAEEVNRSYREILEEFKNDISVRAFLPPLLRMGVKERLASSC